MRTVSRSIAFLLLFVTLCTCLLFTLTGCTEEASLATQEAVSYENLKAKVDVFDNVYAYYFSDLQDELQVSSGEGETPAGTICRYTYVTNLDGKNKANSIKSCTLEITFDDSSMRYDEYFAIDASTLFIARTDVPVDDYGTTTKFIFTNNTLYQIDETNAALIVVDKPDVLDFYLAFNDLTDLYGPK